MHERFVDRKDKRSFIEECPDFKLRHHTAPPKNVIYLFVAVLLSVVVIAIHLAIKLLNIPADAVVPTFELFTAIAVMGVLVGGAAIFACVLIYKIQHIILETEFQSLIFASSARAESEFCLITSSEKVVVYSDYNFNQTFSAFKDRSNAFKRLIKHGGLKKADKDRLTRAVEDNKTVKVPFTLTKPNGDEVKMVIKSNPLNRPEHFSVIRGYTKI